MKQKIFKVQTGLLAILPIEREFKQKKHVLTVKSRDLLKGASISAK